MSHAYFVDDRARRDLRRIDAQARERILSAVARLAAGAELAGDVKRLRGSDEYRLRVGDWRVRFERGVASGELDTVPAIAEVLERRTAPRP